MNSPILETVIDAYTAVYDARPALPVHPRLKYRERDPAQIDTIVIHKSGADGPAGLAGMVGCARFCIDHRGWPGFPYTYWLPRVPNTDPEGRFIIYRGNGDDVRSYHTGGRMNAVGIGVALQGAYDGEWDLTTLGVPKVERHPTEAQWRMLKALVKHLVEHWNIVVVEKTGPDDDYGLTGHWEHGKPICPGDALREWIEIERGSLVVPLTTSPLDRSITMTFDTKKLQRALKLLGYSPGPEDGMVGYRTRAALELFQAAANLTVDGWFGPRTAAALQAALAAKGLADPIHFA